MSFSGLRLAVTGMSGQVVSALIEAAPRDVEIIALGRPQLELSVRGAVLSSLRHARCNAIINAAAYTQVDQAEREPDVAMRVNGAGAGNVAEAARELNVPLVHLSTDYVFDGSLLGRPYREDDPVGPQSVYGRSKLEGEERISKTYSNHVILRTSWIYSPFGHNFVKTMLRLGRVRDCVDVVSDQTGNPSSALDIAKGVITIARKLIIDPRESLRGVFHMSGAGPASWAEVAEEIFATAQQSGRSPVRVNRITTSQYPTLARRPLNSQLDNSKLISEYGIEMPPWRPSLRSCVVRLHKEEI